MGSQRTAAFLLVFGTCWVPSGEAAAPQENPEQQRDLRPARAWPPEVQSTEFGITSLKDVASIPFRIAEEGLYSVEISFRCADSDRRHDRLSLTFRSAKREWFARYRQLDPETGYRFYFWVNEEMRRGLPRDGTLLVELGRLDRVRERDVYINEFGPPRRELITLPRIEGRIHLRPPQPIAVTAVPAAEAAEDLRSLQREDILHYRVNVEFPRLEGRMRPWSFKSEYRVPRGSGSMDAGGVLLRGGRWLDRKKVKSSGTYDFLASAGRLFTWEPSGAVGPPDESDWKRFEHEGLLFVIDDRRTITGAASFYFAGGETPPTYYVAELEEIRLSAVPDEGEGPFWLRFNNSSALIWDEPDTGDFSAGRRTVHSQAQLTSTRIPFTTAAGAGAVVRPQVPLFVVPVSRLDRVNELLVTSNPHYFHEMSTVEEGKFIYESTEAAKVVTALITQDPAMLVEGMAEWVVQASRQRNPDLYRSFGSGTFTTSSNRGWGRGAERFTVEGSSTGSVSFRDVAGSSGRDVATVTTLNPGSSPKRHFSSTIRVRDTPGIFVDGATIRVRSVKTNRDFNGHIGVSVYVAGHNGGREKTSGRGLEMERAAVGTPFAFAANRIAERGPYMIESGAARNIDFAPIDFEHPDNDPDSLWEQLHHTLGAWAGVHIRISLVEVEMRDRQTDLNPRRMKTVRSRDTAHLTIYPWDHLYDPTWGRLRNDVHRDGDWLVLSDRLRPNGELLDEVELEVRLRVQARDTGPMIRSTTRQ